MDEILKRQELLKKYEEIKTKIDSLDPETKELVLGAIRRTEFELRTEIGMIERNMQMSYFEENKATK